jgi:hypothetical protein
MYAFRISRETATRPLEGAAETRTEEESKIKMKSKIRKRSKSKRKSKIRTEGHCSCISPTFPY